MNMMLYYRRLFLSFCGAIALFLTPGLHAQSASITSVARLSNGQTRVTVTGSSGTAVMLQGSMDLKSWSDLQSLTLSGSAVVYTDTTTTTTRQRFYRVHGSAATTELPELANLPNAVFPAPEGFNTIQYAPNGRLGFIVWKNQNLIFRERDTSGNWQEQTVSGGGGVFTMGVFTFSGLREDYKFQPSAILLYDSSSAPHVFKVSGTSVIHYSRSNGSWAQKESIADGATHGNLTVLVGAVGANNVFHLAALGSGDTQNITYGSNRSGQWNWTAISNVRQTPLTYWAPPFAPRWFSLAVDSKNNAHMTYREGLDLTYDAAGHPLAYSEVRYASNKSGQWVTRLIMKPDNQSAEADNGASIAVGPDDLPRIVSWYDERADTGSAQWSRMYFHQQDASGNWSTTALFSRPDGYIAGDGEKGTGFSPYLRFDSRGRGHILFLDHAGEHFSNIGQQEYAGNLRHAWWDGAQWQVETIYRQTNVLGQEIMYPAFAMNGNEMAVTLLDRQTQWNLSSYPPLSNSTYRFRFFMKPLP
jgi:hypothetical protein